MPVYSVQKVENMASDNTTLKQSVATLGRFTRFDSGFHGSLETTCEQGPVKAAVACRQAPSRERYTRVERSRASGGVEMSFRRTP